MNKDNEVLHPFENLALWQHFINDFSSNKGSIALVEKHVEYALPLLDDFKKAFPKYTLHNLRHQQNIIRLIGEILGEEVKKLSSLECAILILSAVYHDIGMVFTDSELEKITQEDEFKTFLSQNIKARLQFEENNQVAQPDLVEWYCRWMHAERVWHFLNPIHQKLPLNWGIMPFKDALGTVCQSHNESISFIKNSDVLETDFIGECDLKFCAILLRLADILDFDNTRSPLSSYEFLNLNNPINSSESTSSFEWNKHLYSEKFIFKRENGSLNLLFNAAPPHPKIEEGIRNFLKIIEKELQGCSKILKFCSSRWAHFKLPESIDRSGIKSNNYKSGSFHFSLSEEKILDLLTGEGLYDDEYVFIRELLQNAIDTSRHREFLERLTNPTFQVEPILVSYIKDTEGYHWVRIDDFGRGMNEEIIENHLLKKGESYYNSDRFKLDKLSIKEKSNIDFVPISRFGIGLLSCFIVGDKIELNTKYFDKNDTNNIESYRVSVEGRNGLFILQSKNERHYPLDMPSQYGDDQGYRTQYGTSIAVRLMPNKEYLGFNLLEKLNEYVHCSPIPIKFENKLVGGDFQELLNKPWAKETSVLVDVPFIKEVEDLFEVKIPNGIKIDVLPIDITNNSLDKNLKGQVIFIGINAPDFQTEPLKSHNRVLALESSHNQLTLKCIKKYKEADVHKEAKLEYDLNEILNHLSLPNNFKKKQPFPELDELFRGFYLSHNGIVINDGSNFFRLNRKLIELHHHQPESYREFLYTGILYFQDHLLPNLSVSRNNIKNLNYNIIAHLTYSLKELNKYIIEDEAKFSFFERIERGIYITTRDIKNSNFYESNTSFWDAEKLISSITHNKVISVYDLKEANEDIIEIILPNYYRYNYNRYFYSYIIQYIIAQNFEVQLKIYKPSEYDSYATLLLKQLKSPQPEFILDFKPLKFIEFATSEKTIVFEGILNLSHPLIQWYVRCFPILRQNFYNYSIQLLNTILLYNRDEERVEEANQILNRLRELLSREDRPSEELNLTLQDFKVNIEM